MDERIDGWVDGQMDEKVAVHMDGWMGGLGRLEKGLKGITRAFGRRLERGLKVAGEGLKRA